MRSQLPDDLADTLTLDAVADPLRITRNDAGHPTGREVDEDTAYTHLQMAARYLEDVCSTAAFRNSQSHQAVIYLGGLSASEAQVSAVLGGFADQTAFPPSRTE
jgi:hypothetical protein